MSIFFNAFHSPLGAHSSFTLGCRGKSGGLGLEMGTPAKENIYIGVENREDTNFRLLPFFNEDANEAMRYTQKDGVDCNTSYISQFNEEDIEREYKIESDTFRAPDLEVKILSSPIVAPDPDSSKKLQQMFSYCPAILVEFKIDNSRNSRERRAIFGYSPENSTDSLNKIHNLPMGYHGIARGRNTGIFTNEGNAIAAQGFSPENILQEVVTENLNFGLGNVGLLIFTVPPREIKIFQIAIAFYRDGIVTSGEDTSYWYTRFYKSINSVATYALDNFSKYKDLSKETEQLFHSKNINEAQYFQLTHSIRSYFGSTQLLDWDGEPFWVVNEGEYRMMNTFDLTVDQLFFELRQNPWTVKNILDMFTKRYSYSDNLHFPGGENIIRGGISFTHDMGRENHISRPHFSTYEQFSLTGCFSHMTHEQLINWVLCAALYVDKTDDSEWFLENRNIFSSCLDSMLNRDHPNPDKRDGIMGLDSSRTLDGAEITTYDSLDQSLGQARNNVYMAVKSWASYLAMEKLLDSDLAKICRYQAQKASITITSFLNKDGYIPAIMGEECDSKIIPAIEGLIFPYYLGMMDKVTENGEYRDLIISLKTHFKSVLKKGVCLYDDNGWKLSSSADNSWLSKIYLCQFVAREILGFKTDETGIKADIAHKNWLLKDENLFFAWSDQMRSGVAHGSKYYPRGVTSILWLEEKNIKK